MRGLASCECLAAGKETSARRQHDRLWRRGLGVARGGLRRVRCMTQERRAVPKERLAHYRLGLDVGGVVHSGDMLEPSSPVGVVVLGYSQPSTDPFRLL